MRNPVSIQLHCRDWWWLRPRKSAIARFIPFHCFQIHTLVCPNFQLPSLVFVLVGCPCLDYGNNCFEYVGVWRHFVCMLELAVGKPPLHTHEYLLTTIDLLVWCSTFYVRAAQQTITMYVWLVKIKTSLSNSKSGDKCSSRSASTREVQALRSRGQKRKDRTLVGFDNL